VTPGNTAPELSLTVPAIALVCADATVADATTSSVMQAAPETIRAKLRIPIPS
jgi:hypothetical protein